MVVCAIVTYTQSRFNCAIYVCNYSVRVVVVDRDLFLGAALSNFDVRAPLGGTCPAGVGVLRTGEGWNVRITNGGGDVDEVIRLEVKSSVAANAVSK